MILRAVQLTGLLAAVATLWFGLNVILDALPRLRAADKWQAVPCRVIETRVVDLYPPDVGFRVTYEYWVGGELATGHQVDLFSDLAMSSEYQDAMREQRELVCYYDPDNRHDSVLERGWSGTLSGQLAAWWMASLFFWGVVLVIHGYRRKALNDIPP